MRKPDLNCHVSQKRPHSLPFKFFEEYHGKLTDFDIFGSQHPEETGHQKHINVPTSSTNCYHTTLGSAKLIFQLYSAAFLIFFSLFHNIHHFKAVKYGTLLLTLHWMFKVTSFCQSYSSIRFRDWLHSSSALWMNWLNHSVYGLHGCLCTLNTSFNVGS